MMCRYDPLRSNPNALRPVLALCRPHVRRLRLTLVPAHLDFHSVWDQLAE